MDMKPPSSTHFPKSDSSLPTYKNKCLRKQKGKKVFNTFITAPETTIVWFFLSDFVLKDKFTYCK